MGQIQACGAVNLGLLQICMVLHFRFMALIQGSLPDLFKSQYKELSVFRSVKGDKSFFLVGELPVTADGRQSVLAAFCLFFVLQLKKDSLGVTFFALSVLSSSMAKQIKEYVFCIPTEYVALLLCCGVGWGRENHWKKFKVSHPWWVTKFRRLQKGTQCVNHFLRQTSPFFCINYIPCWMEATLDHWAPIISLIRSEGASQETHTCGICSVIRVPEKELYNEG